MKLIFEISLCEKKLPIEWKYANITPIYKKKVQGQMLVITDRSVLHVLCKIMESIIQDYIMSHFHNNNFFSQKQFRFIKGRSTTIQLLHIMDIWMECLEQGGQMDVIYTDLEKAFNKIPHHYMTNQHII